MLPFFFLPALCLAIEAQLTLPDDAESALDPSRSSVTLSAPGFNETVYHFLENGTVQFGDLSAGTYRVVFNSLDLTFLKGNQFDLVINNDTTYEVYNPFGKDYPEVPEGLTFTPADVRYKEYADGDSEGSFIDNLPLVPLIKQYPMLGGLLAAMIGMIISPMIISYFDPDFNERYIRDQQEQAALAAQQSQQSQQAQQAQPGAKGGRPVQKKLN